MSFDIEKIRRQFPALAEKTKSGKPIVYFDNAATSHKPQCVIDAISDFYAHNNANIHRSAHDLSERATIGYERARENVRNFLNADDSYCAIFTRGATEGLNLVASSWAGANLKPGDEILLTQMEHHANIVPWQIAAEHTGAEIKVVKILPDGSLDMGDLKNKLSEKTKIVSVAHASNVLGTINDIAAIGAMAHSAGAKFCVDAAQSAPHFLDDISKSNCDFLSLSAHKLFGPTGIGALIAKREILDSMPPYQGGGDMIDSVSWSGTTFRPSPERFEAGTPDIAGAFGFSAAIDYLRKLDIPAAREHEHRLLDQLTKRLSDIKNLKIFGAAKDKVCVVSFSVARVHPNDISVLLNASGIAIRTGHHCAEPLMGTLGVDATARASLAFYNTAEEVDFFADKLERAVAMLA